ncbi:serine/threonine-protein kinase Nek6-like [Callorhinchus milii]|uniref:serine/threonine-protein kinase Nek6-like n=1 Tax=Callorhinchus milii TaxID=7868 RepID=UPI001C3FD4B1|nr:serine/threonine-protein kinase Nek6-like [Callorhinchus milii]
MEEQRNGRSRPLEDQKLLYRRPAPGDQPEPQRHLFPYHSRLADYQMEKKIGRGQFSEVYRATCLRDGKAVALKKVQLFEMLDAKARQDCIKEIDLLKLLLV